jgi:putative flippase GtrA
MRHILAQFTQREAHPTIQFIKYAMAGGVATATDMVVFFVLAFTIFPALTEAELLVRLFAVEVPEIAQSIRERNFVINSVIAFAFANLVAYVINILWVFEPGRHKRHVEVILFYTVSTAAIFVGTFLGWAMIRFLGATTEASYLGKVIAAVMINFVCRKYIVFKG